MHLKEGDKSLATILIVDDQASNIKIVHEVVRDFGEILFATNGQDAIDIARKSHPDLILLDIEMPDMDGFAVCKAIKSDPALCNIAIIFITSHTDDPQEIAALEMGGIDFLNKPLNFPIARARIQTHLALRLKSKQLLVARRDLEDVVQNLPAFVAHWDRELHNIFANDIDGKWYGMPSIEMKGKHIKEVIGEINFFNIEKHIQAVLNGTNNSFDITFINNYGKLLYGQASLVQRNLDDLESGFLMLITDVTERKIAELALYEEKERIRITLNSIGDAVIATDQNGIITFLNPIAEVMTGWLLDEAVGLPIEQVMPLREGENGRALQNPIRLALKERRTVGMVINCTLIRRDGHAFQVEDSAAPIRDQNEDITGAIIVFHDVSEARAMAIKMTHLANHDALTNLPNRLLLRDRTEQAMNNAKRDNRRVAFFILDLDHFKTINDSVGHYTGDVLLQEIALRLKQSLRENDTISRQGGDEFVILSPNITDLERVDALAEKILKVVSQPYIIEDNRFDLSVSIGISLYPDDSDDMESLYRHADAAMYKAKKEGRNRFLYFSEEIEVTLKSRHLMTQQLRMSVENENFEVHYQPKVNSQQRIINGAEALVRWRNKEGQLISPLQFIPLCEETGLIVALGQFVLRQACLDAVKWHKNDPTLRIAVNVSVMQITDSDFINILKNIIEETGINSSLLELEITEGVLAGDNLKTMETLNAIKALGVSIAIDDFGTGYSSLAYLKRFPVDVLKIDQSFVRDMLIDTSDAGIVEAIVHMAKSLHLRLVAEGVESQEQAQALLKLGCVIMQGYFFGKPMPNSDFEMMLERGLK
jgi:diguanylate cyclase (GGDEF)-like protein/PAS domain S-box-containing protein